MRELNSAEIAGVAGGWDSSHNPLAPPTIPGMPDFMTGLDQGTGSEGGDDMRLGTVVTTGQASGDGDSGQTFGSCLSDNWVLGSAAGMGVGAVWGAGAGCAAGAVATAGPGCVPASAVGALYGAANGAINGFITTAVTCHIITQ